jgi:hypothetical protein
MAYEYVQLVPTSAPSTTPTPKPTSNPVVGWAEKNPIIVVSVLLMILIYIWMRPVTFPGDLFAKWLERVRIALMGVPPPIQEYVDMRISSEVAAQVAAQLAALQLPTA